jgi:hypothetical protein
MIWDIKFVCRMLKDYVAQKKGAEVADHASEQELMENLMERCLINLLLSACALFQDAMLSF